MSYAVYLSNGSLLTTIQDGTVDHSTSLSLLGRLYVDYGTVIASDLVHMLENSANGLPPVNPLVGQLWYDGSINVMKVWNGSVWSSLTAVSSVLGNTGAVTLSQMVAGGLAPLVNPDFTAGIPLGPTAVIGTSTNQLATTAFVLSQLGIVAAGVASVMGFTGAVTLPQLITAVPGLAPLASPALIGVPTGPTALTGTASTQLATTAFVQNAINSQSGTVISVLGFTGAVTATELSTVLAPLVSPNLSGAPTAPTAASGTATLQLATTAFVQNAVAAQTIGVASVLGYTGAVTLGQLTTIPGLAPLASPALTGVPTAPTATANTATTQLATTAFVQQSIVSRAGSAMPLVDGVASIGSSILFARQDHIHPTDASRQVALGYTPVQQSGGIGQAGNKIYIGWSGSAVKCTVDQTDEGAFAMLNAAQTFVGANLFSGSLQASHGAYTPKSQQANGTYAGGNASTCVTIQDFYYLNPAPNVSYMRYPNGVIEICFTAAVNSNGGYYTTDVPFPYSWSFPTATSDCQVCWDGTTPPQGFGLSITLYSTTSVAVTTNTPTGSTGTLGVWIRVKGY